MTHPFMASHKILFGKSRDLIRTVELHTNGLIHFSGCYCGDYTLVDPSAKTTERHCSPAKRGRSKRALAIPVTFLILFVSMLGIISATYYVAVQKVNARSQTLKISTARQDFVSLDQSIHSILWQPGAARAFEIADSGGKLRVQPQTDSLTLNLTDGRDIDTGIYSQNIGEIAYELPYTDSPDTGLYLRGDSRPIANQSGSGLTQLSIQRGFQHAEIVLRYRPIVFSSSAGVENGKAVTLVRIYVVNLNSSDSISSYGKLPLKISSESSTVMQTRFEVAYEVGNLQITSAFGTVSGQVEVPISSDSMGAIIEVEVVECNIKVERSLR